MISPTKSNDSPTKQTHKQRLPRNWAVEWWDSSPSRPHLWLPPAVQDPALLENQPWKKSLVTKPLDSQLGRQVTWNPIPKCSMYGIFTYIFSPQNLSSAVGKTRLFVLWENIWGSDWPESRSSAIPWELHLPNCPFFKNGGRPDGSQSKANGRTKQLPTLGVLSNRAGGGCDIKLKFTKSNYEPTDLFLMDERRVSRMFMRRFFSCEVVKGIWLPTSLFSNSNVENRNDTTGVRHAHDSSVILSQDWNRFPNLSL